jgi:nicotinate-nucleotide pyrophosphorylase (carboxylating)
MREGAPRYSVDSADYLPIIGLALREDLGELGDVTSQAVVPDGERSATLWSKDDGVLAGEEVFAAVFRAVDADARVTFHLHDGETLARGARVATVAGRALSLLSAERTALNFIALLTGIATATRELVLLARASGKAVILDTRKTLPGMRALCKYAVTVGGGENHRQGLYDMVLLKDNHVDSAGGVTAAVRRVRERWGSRFPIEVECRSAAEVEEALAAGVTLIMLDNMDTAAMAAQVRRIGGRARVEASGNMGRERIPEVSAAGVDCISVGALTHSVHSFDFSLKVD